MQIDLESRSFKRHVVSDLSDTLFAQTLFDRLPDIVFSVKDPEGRYVAISEACVDRCGLRDKRDALGKTAYDLFPSVMADRYAAQDKVVFANGRPVVDNLDLTMYRDRRPGWCLSSKEPLYDRYGRLIGLICLSKDLTELSREAFIDERFAETIDFIQSNYHRQVSLEELSDISGLSIARLDRRMKRVFLMSTGQFVRKTRLEAALMALAQTSHPIAEVALDCGFFDQSALTRQVRQATGMSPREYRQLQQRTA
ncbi:AraC family transcriptional regulator [Parachitinimonas caeni]|uniref:AraC family transcriptional regulator n=1 Tax=Parachitinimonas caeni TaxID=3031301 RepID=A0ABT7DQS7_9NEIS|nr:AraC family transcriptional regulator [Parachitinimonas caeni]MDK2122428.1 AraC family transcriptional regulator [Parachitinimonas caeni]